MGADRYEMYQEAVAEKLRLEAELARLREERDKYREMAHDISKERQEIGMDRIEELVAERDTLLAAHGKGKCVPAGEFEKAKEPIFAEGMRAGCEDLMREAARMDDTINTLLTALRDLIEAKRRDEIQIEGEWGVSTDPGYGEESDELKAARAAISEVEGEKT